MNVTAVVVVLVVLIVAVAAAGWWFWTQQRQRRELQRRFGPEYDHAVAEYGDRKPAEEALEARSQRVAGMEIRPLEPAESARFSERWHTVQGQFVDDPEHAIGAADRLCEELMQARGYPTGDFTQQAADVSVNHPRVVEHYRMAHKVAGRAEHDHVSTEELRQAIVHYRAVFDDLLETREPARS